MDEISLVGVCFLKIGVLKKKTRSEESALNEDFVLSSISIIYLELAHKRSLLA